MTHKMEPFPNPSYYNKTKNLLSIKFKTDQADSFTTCGASRQQCKTSSWCEEATLNARHRPVMPGGGVEKKMQLHCLFGLLLWFLVAARCSCFLLLSQLSCSRRWRLVFSKDAKLATRY